MKFTRIYEKLDSYFAPNRALLIMGPRRVGKTTLLQEYLAHTRLKYEFVNGDNVRIADILGSQDFERIFAFVQNLELLVIDEAQLIPNIGMGLKILVDHRPDLKIIATGSSSFDLAGQVGEPLVGRKNELKMFPLSILEMKKQHSDYEIERMLPEFLIYGSYPAIVAEEKLDVKQSFLIELRDSYLFKDILALQEVKGAKVLLDILKLLAFQVGGEVSLTEIGAQVGLDYKTVARYLDLFEKSYIIFNLRGYSRNLRNEVTSKGKYYFYDNGLRNAVISSFNALEDRNDIGQLWENFLVSERLKKMAYQNMYGNVYFWRTWDQKEIDLVEERDGKLFGFEFKYTDTQAKHAKAFMEIYTNAEVQVINKENYLDFVC